METESIDREDAVAGRRWFIVDVNGLVLGRIASRIASVLRGKHHARYTPHIDTGDFVIVLNAKSVRLTGKKEEKKMYYSHTGWVGGVVAKTAAEVRDEDGRKLIEEAVWGMMPKGPLGRAMFRKLKIYEGGEHPHSAQKPEPLAV